MVKQLLTSEFAEKSGWPQRFGRFISRMSGHVKVREKICLTYSHIGMYM